MVMPLTEEDRVPAEVRRRTPWKLVLGELDSSTVTVVPATAVDGADRAKPPVPAELAPCIPPGP